MKMGVNDLKEDELEKDFLFIAQLQTLGFSAVKPSPTENDNAYVGYLKYKELIITEMRYIETIGFIDDNMQKELQARFEKLAKGKKLGKNDAKWSDVKPLFVKLTELKQKHQQFLSVLREKEPSQWGKEIEEMKEAQLEYAILYGKFLKKAPLKKERIRNLIEGNFGKSNQSWESILQSPIQRFPRYQLLMQELVKAKNNDEQATQLLNLVTNANAYVNNGLKQHEKKEVVADEFAIFLTSEQKKKLPRNKASRSKVQANRMVFAEINYQLQQPVRQVVEGNDFFVLAFKEAYRKALESKVLGKQGLDPEYKSAFDVAIESLSTKRLTQLGTNLAALKAAKEDVLQKFKQPHQPVPVVATSSQQMPTLNWKPPVLPTSEKTRRTPLINSAAARALLTKPSANSALAVQPKSVKNLIKQFEDKSVVAPNPTTPPTPTRRNPH